MTDPTYVPAEIAANPTWALAFRLSEVDNDNAPIGWSRYISLAHWLMETYDLMPKGATTEVEQLRTYAMNFYGTEFGGLIERDKVLAILRKT